MTGYKARTLGSEKLIYFFTSLLVVTVFIFPEEAGDFMAKVNNFTIQHFDWLILLIANVFLVFILYIAFSKYGEIKIGGPEAKIEFSDISWLCMLFAAGLGAGLVIYGVSEPLVHTVKPPFKISGDMPSQAEAARNGLVFSFINWGVHGWSFYTACAVCFAYFGFNLKRGMRTGAFIEDLTGRKAPHAVLITMDIVAMTAVLFGLLATLSLGTIGFAEGVGRIFPGFDGNDAGNRVMIFLFMAVLYTLSATTSIGEGIKILSNINIFIGLVLLVFVLFAGEPSFILRAFTSAVGEYFNNFLKLSTDLKPFSKQTKWVEDWTVNYYLWWAAWCPFIGVFIARISYGRTFRQFILGSLLLPSLILFLWFSVFGGNVIYQVLFENNLSLQEAIIDTPEKGLFFLLSYLPYENITIVISTVLMCIFLVTSADSAAYVTGMLASGKDSPGRPERLFGASVITALTVYLLVYEYDSGFLRNIAVFGAAPYVTIISLQLIALNKALRKHGNLL